MLAMIELTDTGSPRRQVLIYTVVHILQVLFHLLSVTSNHPHRDRYQPSASNREQSCGHYYISVSMVQFSVGHHRLGELVACGCPPRIDIYFFLIVLFSWKTLSSMLPGQEPNYLIFAFPLILCRLYRTRLMVLYHALSSYPQSYTP